MSACPHAGRPEPAPRSYTNLADAAEEALISRVFAGAHYNQSSRDALDIGLKLGAYAWRNVDKLIYGRASKARWTWSKYTIYGSA